MLNFPKPTPRRRFGKPSMHIVPNFPQREPAAGSGKLGTFSGQNADTPPPDRSGAAGGRIRVARQEAGSQWRGRRPDPGGAAGGRIAVARQEAGSECRSGAREITNACVSKYPRGPATNRPATVMCFSGTERACVRVSQAGHGWPAEWARTVLAQRKPTAAATNRPPPPTPAQRGYAPAGIRIPRPWSRPPSRSAIASLIASSG